LNTWAPLLGPGSPALAAGQIDTRLDADHHGSVRHP